MNDLISLRAAIKAINDLPNCYNGYSDTYDKACIIGMLEEVPTIEPKKVVDDYCIPRNLMVVGAECFRLFTEPKRGHWIKMSDADGVYWACSECGEDIPRIAHYDPQFDLFPRLESIDRTNYCPNCGAPMEVSEE